MKRFSLTGSFGLQFTNNPSMWNFDGNQLAKSSISLSDTCEFSNSW